MTLQQTRETLDVGAPQAKMLDEATERLRRSLAELRQLSRGLQPALLTERGLEVALRELILHLPMPVSLEVDVPVRPSEPWERAAYFVVAEALQNVTRHAPTASAKVAVESDGQSLTTCVTENGPGGATSEVGSGLRGLADRVAASGGTLDINSLPGQGMTLRARLPLRPRQLAGMDG